MSLKFLIVVCVSVSVLVAHLVFLDFPRSWPHGHDDKNAVNQRI